MKLHSNTALGINIAGQRNCDFEVPTLWVSLFLQRRWVYVNPKLCFCYIRYPLLKPPASATATTIEAICKLMSYMSCSLPEFTCVAPSKVLQNSI
ncbi:hypothetical protein L1987_83575 [Smallanthus sonchifolius]|uniref:Uncharacterized protein n=1 Tax=Smallanthus sonchifolius TaxID=185202 RepID=A0ACB8YGI8_9ASTR|nr:hypothetical protein L1987_83575 [Smallanthus sonchifolius]